MGSDHVNETLYRPFTCGSVGLMTTLSARNSNASSLCFTVTFVGGDRRGQCHAHHGPFLRFSETATGASDSWAGQPLATRTAACLGNFVAVCLLLFRGFGPSRSSSAAKRSPSPPPPHLVARAPLVMVDRLPITTTPAIRLYLHRARREGTT